MHKTSLWIGTALSLGLTPSFPALAQSIVPAADGTGTIVQYNGNIYQIEGGTQAGANLFHSFQTLGLGSGEIANFLSHPSVSHIFGRVTGGDPSVIDGLIQVTGAHSHLYLMNPAGIVFGSGVSLNIGGDFVATTSDRIGFTGGGFNATGANDYASLVGAPNQFAFVSEQPGAILNFGNLTTGQDMSLMGGTIFNQGNLVSTEGNITLAAIPGERWVQIGQPGMLLSLEVDAGAIAAGIQPLNLPTLLTGSEQLTNRSAGVPPAIHSFNEGDLIIDGAVSGQHIDLYATGQVTPANTDLVQGDTRVTRFSTTGENPKQGVFIDARADHSEDLLFGAEAGTVSQIIERDEDGIEVVSEQLSIISESVGDLESVAIIAEGNEGNFWLGNQWIRGENIADYATQLQTWDEALTASADILLYSCFTALGATGESLVQSIANLTGADVAASVDATGSANYSGNWDLEYSSLSGSIEAGNPFTRQTLNAWDGKLATRTVTDFADSGANTLRGQIAVANPGDLVMFASAGTVTLTTGEISWSTDNLTIDGNGSTVDGNNNGRVFRIAADNATIQNITIQNGSTNYSGGGIYHGAYFPAATGGSGTLTIRNSTITGNSAHTGGGVYSGYRNVSYGDLYLQIIDSVISGNNAEYWGGGVYGENNVSISGSQIFGNSTTSTAMPYGGGGVFARDTLNISDSTISDNSSTRQGGGIYAQGTTTISGSTITNNQAANDGGGAFVEGNITVSDSTIANNQAANQGGGLYLEINKADLAMTGSILSENTANAASDPGGDIHSRQNLVTISDPVGDLVADLFIRREPVSISSNGSITLTGEIDTRGNQKDVSISAAGTINISGLTLITTDRAVGSGLGNGSGDITLTAGGDIYAQRLITFSSIADGGNVTVTSTDGRINISGDITTFAGDDNTDAGNVTLDAKETVQVGYIDAEAQGAGGQGGNVSISSDQTVQIQGSFLSTNRGFNASISSAGRGAGGSIIIEHGGNSLIPFVVGDASLNGTAAAITAGSSATIFPTNSYLFSHRQTGIQILTNGVGPELSAVVAGSTPVNPFLNASDLVTSILGDSVGGAISDITYSVELEEIDLADSARAEEFGVDDVEEEAEGNSGDESGGGDDNPDTVANIRETFDRIQTQTGTVPALIYATSNPDYLELIVITPDDQMLRTVVPAASRAQLLNTVRRFRRRVTSPGSSRYLEPAQQLYDWLIRPIEGTMANLGIDTLVFSMSDGLRSIPLAALHDGEQFLVEKYSLGQIPSMSLTDTSYTPLHDASVLAMGASEFDQFSPLPAVPSELALITEQQGGEKHLNNAFTWENLKTQSRDRNFKIVHLATHAAFQPGQAANSFIQLWGEDQIGVNELRELRWFDAPTVELLVLSACETAFGDPHAELGFAGLAVQSGVKSALASLWQVSDFGTLVLMSEFYDALGNPEITIKAEALRQAQLALLNGNSLNQTGAIRGVTLPADLSQYTNTDLSHPFYWSGFTLIGSPW
ncbi:MAG: CHAT domain-containing protein [Cyanobacteria bacterium P01_G01_bin.54]